MEFPLSHAENSTSSEGNRRNKNKEIGKFSVCLEIFKPPVYLEDKICKRECYMTRPKRCCIMEL